MNIQIEPHTLQRAEERGTNMQKLELFRNKDKKSPPKAIGRQKQRFSLSTRNGLVNITSKNESKWSMWKRV